MKISIVAVGKIKEPFFQDGIAEYAKRLRKFCTLELIEVEDEKLPEPLTAGMARQALAKEGMRLQSKIKPGGYVIALDVGGKKFSSPAFAQVAQDVMTSGKSAITFVIGGSLGFDADFLKQVDLRVSMSDMTFPHQFARMMLLEQVYRAFKILNNETYHK